MMTLKIYRDAGISSSGILGRYKINNPQGNSPVASSGDQYVNAFTLYPELVKSLNKDNTMNELLTFPV